jgi:hypothetical protein
MKYIKQYEAVKLRSDVEYIFKYELEGNGLFNIMATDLTLDQLSPSKTSVDVMMVIGFSDNEDIMELNDKTVNEELPYGAAEYVSKKASEMIKKISLKHNATIDNFKMSYINWDRCTATIEFKINFL